MSASSETLQRYYRIHAAFYDATRWAFLFGREQIIRELLRHAPSPQRILEVGCGTGKNLQALHRSYPDARLCGVDLSREMLGKARRKCAGISQLELHQQRYDAPLAPGSFDVVLFSYALSMFNPGWEEALRTACRDLAPGGILAMVDFHNSRFPLFKSWMAKNHVRMDAHLLPLASRLTTTRFVRECSAFGGLWTYHLFLGEKTV